MQKKGLFFISDYRDVTCKPGRDPSYWILKALNEDDRFNVYSTANRIIDSSCFGNIKFSELNYGRKVDIQRPFYNYAIYKAYMKVKSQVRIIHHCEKFQVGVGYNFIPILSNVSDKTLFIGPIEVPHKVFDEDNFVGLKEFDTHITKFIYKNKKNIRPIFRYLFKKTIENADKVIVPNNNTKKELMHHISKNNIEVINFSVDLSKYKKYNYVIDENNFNIIYAGSAIERKGVIYLLKAISLIKKDYPKVKLHLRTSGYKVREYIKILKELDLCENVVFYGHLELNEYLKLLSRSRLLCLPTLSDSYCYTVLDAMCLGVPVVATTECKCDDLFENGDIGLMVEPKNSEKLADAILTLFSDIDLCIKFSENGLKKREKFDHKKTIPKYIELYEKYL